MAKVKATGAGNTPSRSWLWLQGAVCGGLVVITPGAALLLGTLLIVPGLMLVLEQTPGRPLTRSMMLLTVATVFSPVLQLWEHGGSLTAAVDILAEPLVLLCSWAASGAAWLLIQLWEVFSLYIIQKADGHAVKLLKQERSDLISEWRNIV